jgi:Holliday junction DNA helicase RuvB
MIAEKAVLYGELLRLKAKWGEDLSLFLRAVLEVAVERDRPFDNYLHVQGLFSEMGGKGFLRILSDLEMAGILQRRRGDVHFPWDENVRQDPEVVALVREFLESESQSGDRTHPGPADTGPGVELPPNLFEEIAGHEDVKELLRACVLLERPVHVLLVGPPALAKSLFLLELERAFGDRAQWLLGSSTSKAGLLDLLLEREPWLLLIDELERMNPRDQDALLSVMEGGRIAIQKRGMSARRELNVRVVAASNDVKRIPVPLLSRFAVKRVRPYSREEFVDVVRRVLQRREGLSEGEALEVASLLSGRTADIRDAVRAARLSRKVGIQRAVELLF